MPQKLILKNYVIEKFSSKMNECLETDFFLFSLEIKYCQSIVDWDAEITSNPYYA
jgi:hypothetical protein